MYEPTQEVIVGEVRLRGTVPVAALVRLLGPEVAALLPYEIQRMKALGLVAYDEPLGSDSVLRLPEG